MSVLHDPTVFIPVDVGPLSPRRDTSSDCKWKLPPDTEGRCECTEYAAANNR
jgi:hypothetical protein